MKLWDFNNPWKNAVIFFVIANIVFFSSPNLVLLGALFLIFYFSFNLIKKTFLDSINIEIVSNKNFYHAHYNAIIEEADKTIAHFEFIMTMPVLITHFFGSFRTNVALYSCPKLPTNTNYLFLYLEKHYLLTRWRLTRQLNLNIVNQGEKNRFIEKLARKIL